MIIYPEKYYNNIFDSHAHLDDERFEEIRPELVNGLKEHGVVGIISCGCDIKSSKKAIEISSKFDIVYNAVGFHPSNIDENSRVSDIELLTKNKKCVAIGEIGLDYYWTKENKTLQLKFFEEQLILAKRLNLPVIVHDREAHADTLELLKKHKPKGVVHCFSGSREMAEEIIKLGMYIGIGGVVTFKNAKKLPEVIEVIPNDRLLVETDCPYLAPEPFRSKLCNSSMISLTCEKIAEIRKSSPQEILNITRENARVLFGV